MRTAKGCDMAGYLPPGYSPAQPQAGMSTAAVPLPNSVLAGVPRGSKARSTLTRSFAAFFAALVLLGGSWLSLQRETQQEPAPVQTSLIDVGVSRLRAAAATAAASPPAASRIILAAASPPPPPEAAATVAASPPPPPTKAAKQMTKTVRATAFVQQPGDVEQIRRKAKMSATAFFLTFLAASTSAAPWYAGIPSIKVLSPGNESNQQVRA